MDTAVLFVIGIVGVVASFFVAWQVCRASYLAVEKQFNVLFIVLCGLVLTVTGLGWGVEVLGDGAGEWGLAVGWRVLVGVVVAGGLGYWYVRSIRYPQWKMLDMTALGLGWGLLVAGGGMLLKDVVERIVGGYWGDLGSLWLWLSVLAWMGLVLFVMQWWYGRPGYREGVLGGLWLMMVMGALLVGLGWMEAWQREVPFVEWVAVGGGWLGGLVFMVMRWWQPRLASLALQDSPKRVSPDLQKSIGGRVAAKKPAATKPKSKKKDVEEEVVVVPSKSDGVAVVVSDVEEIFAPPVVKPVKKLLKGRSRKKKS